MPSDTAALRIFFSLRHPGSLRNFTSLVRLLADRGHWVHVSFMMQDKLGDGRLLWELSQSHPGVSVGEVVGKMPWRFWLRLARGARAGRDFLRYLEPEYGSATSLRARAEEKTPQLFRRLCRLPAIRGRLGRAALSRFLGLVERAIPSDEAMEAAIADKRPHVVLVSPLVDFASDQVEVVKAARAIGLPTGLVVHSWDNLTNKGLIRFLPERIFVWNEVQEREAVTMHGAPGPSVVVTGAPGYDQWFDRSPSLTRELFCRQVGLPATKPFIVYLCSSPFIASDEAEFVGRWLEAIRHENDARLRSVGVLVRPHPENRQPWQRVDLAGLGNVVLWPGEGANPVDSSSKNDYFNSLYHAVFAVGLNTSALIEAGIVGRAVYSVRAPEYTGTQDGTLHFHHLVNVNGGLLRVASDMGEHLQQLSHALRSTGKEAPPARAFVQGFVRPFGLDQPATPRLADGIEALAREPRPLPWQTPLWLLPLRAALYPLALGLSTVRELERVSRKRQRVLRPLSVGQLFVHTLLRPVDLMLRWRPAKRFVKDYVVPRLVPAGPHADGPTGEMVAVRRLVAKLGRTERPLIVGPWTSEVGLELLYWIPFLNWVRSYSGIPADRIVVVSRGGVASWYRGVGSTYVDLYDYFTPDQLSARNTETVTEGRPKGRVMTDLDREVLKLVQQSLKTRNTAHLHPMQMYALFAPFWSHRASARAIDECTSMERFGRLTPSEGLSFLPARYVAVKFSFNETFPDTAKTRAFVHEVVERLTSVTDVVWLGSSLDVAPADCPQSTRLTRIDPHLSPRNNLEVQTRVISSADAFVGSFGGMAYLPAMCGVRALVFYGKPDRIPEHHVAVARRGFERLAPGSLTLLSVNDLEAVSLLSGRVGGLVGPNARSEPRTAHVTRLG